MAEPKNRLMLVILLLGALAQSDVMAQESSNLQNLHRRVIEACPKQWEKIPELIAHKTDHLESRIIYTNAMKASKVDIWVGDTADRQNYIKYALRHLVDDSGNTLQSFTHPVSVMYQCWQQRDLYLTTKISEMYSGTVSFRDRFDEFNDDDNDGLFNNVDICRDTTNLGVEEGTGLNSIADDFVVDANGCAAWERDEDNDGVSDHYDYCLAVVGAVTTVDGCPDADADGRSNRVDSYPFQHDTLCVD